MFDEIILKKVLFKSLIRVLHKIFDEIGQIFCTNNSIKENGIQNFIIENDLQLYQTKLK